MSIEQGRIVRVTSPADGCHGWGATSARLAAVPKLALHSSTSRTARPRRRADILQASADPRRPVTRPARTSTFRRAHYAHIVTTLTATRVLVTGATAGLGQAMARALTEAGATVAVTGRDRARAGATAEALGAAGRRRAARRP